MKCIVCILIKNLIISRYFNHDLKDFLILQLLLTCCTLLSEVTFKTMKLSLQLAVIALVNVFPCQALVYNEDDYKPWVQFCPPITPDPSLNMTWVSKARY